MAEGLGSSLGWGIAFQGRPDTTGVQIANENMRFNRMQKERERAKKQAEEDKFKEELYKIDVQGVDPMYTPDVQLKTAQFIDLINKKKQSNPYGAWYNDPEVQQGLAQLKFYTNDRVVASKNLREDFATAIQHPERYGLNQEYVDLYKNSQGGVGFKELLGNKFGNDLYVRGTLLNEKSPVVKDFDYLSEFEAKIQPVSGKSKRESDDGSYLKTVGGSYFIEKQNRAIADQIVNNPSSAIGKAALQRWLPSSNGDIEQAKKKASDELFNNLKFRFKPESEETLSNKPDGGDGSGKDKNYRITPVIGKEYNVNIPLVDKETGENRVPGGPDVIIARKSWELNSPIKMDKKYKEYFDPTTWEIVSPSGEVDFEVSSVDEVPTISSGKNKGKVIRQKIADQYPSTTEYKKFASGFIIDSNGNKTPATMDYKVVEPVLKQRKIVLDEKADVPTHTRAEFKSMGWSDALIDKAVSEGKISVK